MVDQPDWFFHILMVCKIMTDNVLTRPNDAELGEETRGSLPTRVMDRGGDACEDSTMGLMSVNLIPDEVVSIIGQIPFWNARSTIIKLPPTSQPNSGVWGNDSN
ncbi:hypothetical protein POM88_013893 [Heracleum sosnowskyi]|uniref:Uncharacterized protein n=1 Tax=Heracleum sosnowskyi TaxID=360622 RepID=A0AAD8IZE8_9APIA|nr:hypothetical protein POM88_013893 [Heracleum sosnowskyi]